MRFSVSTITALAALVATTTTTYATATTTKIGSIKVSRAVAATVASESKSSGLGSNLRRRAEDNAEEGEDGQDQDQDQQEDQDNDENAEDEQQEEEQEENDGGDDADDADNEQDEDQEDGADDADDADGDGDAAASTVSVQGVGCQAFTRELQNVDFDAGNYFYIGQESVVYFNMDLSGYTAQDGDGEQNENGEEANAVSYDTSGSTFMVLADTWMANMAGMAGYEYNGCMQMDEAVVAALTGYVDEAQYQDADEEDADEADDGDEAEADGEADGGERRALRKLRKLQDEDEQDGEEEQQQQQQMMDLYLGAVCDNGSLQLAVFFDNECQAYSPALTYELSILEIDNSSSQQAAAEGEDEAEAQNEEEEDALTFYQTLLTATDVSTQYDIDCDEANDICQQFLEESVDTATCQALNAEEEEQNQDDAAEEEQQDGQAEAEMTYQLYEEDLQDLESTCTAVQTAISNGEDLRAYLEQQGQYVANDSGLSAGAKAGIVIASFAVMALILYVVLQERKRNPPAKPSSSNDTVGSNDSKKQPLIREDVAQLHKISPRQQSRSYTRKTGDI